VPGMGMPSLGHASHADSSSSGLVKGTAVSSEGQPDAPLAVTAAGVEG
jgi:hypothetical protein